MHCRDAIWSRAQASTSTSAPRPTNTSPNKPGYRLEVLEGSCKGRLVTNTQVVCRETVFPLRAEYQAPEDDTDGPSIVKLMLMDDADDDDNLAAAPGVAAGMKTAFDRINTAPAAGMGDTIASRVSGYAEIRFGLQKPHWVH
eukprot:6177950-Pleurochrysis_carterae.AAC.2